MNLHRLRKKRSAKFVLLTLCLHPYGNWIKVFVINGSVILNKRDYGRVITNREVQVGSGRI
ncbi:hypothetical protein CEE39_07650 [bacterium (candidate division B38) B3_B38]|nr:MAG: hypothetical protein CEE39_07650 [bacterium (candidate division B38) B3_B38]